MRHYVTMWVTRHSDGPRHVTQDVTLWRGILPHPQTVQAHAYPVPTKMLQMEDHALAGAER